jgi:hypothetical protein
MSTRSPLIPAPFESWPFCAQTALFIAMLATVIVVKLLMKQNAKVLAGGTPGFVALQHAGQLRRPRRSSPAGVPTVAARPGVICGWTSA